MVKKTYENVVDIGLELERLDQAELVRLSELLHEIILSNLDSMLSPTVDVQVAIELELSEHLSAAIDLTISAPVPLTPDVLAKVDIAIDKALEEFEKIVSQRYAKKIS